MARYKPLLISVLAAVCLWLAPSGEGATAPKKKTTSAPAKTKKKTSKKRSKRARGQQTPTPERYREIQQALGERGYFKGPATGIWGPESVDALKRFQQDQNIQGTGKLDSLTLIALGLGPRRSATAQLRLNHENRSTQGSQGP